MSAGKMPNPSGKMTGKQRMFVSEYLVDLNATQAAIRAGYSPGGAEKSGNRNLRHPGIRAAIAEEQRPRLERLDMDAADVLHELARIARSNVLDYMRLGAEGEPIVDFSGLDRDRASALSEVTVEDFAIGRGADKRDVRRIKFRLHDKLSALDKLAKHYGLLRERMSLENPDGSALEPKHDPRQVARAVVAILQGAGADAGDVGDKPKGGREDV
jgi:phage terminase small subunit